MRWSERGRSIFHYKCMGQVLSKQEALDRMDQEMTAAALQAEHDVIRESLDTYRFLILATCRESLAHENLATPLTLQDLACIARWSDHPSMAAQRLATSPKVVDAENVPMVKGLRAFAAVIERVRRELREEVIDNGKIHAPDLRKKYHADSSWAFRKDPDFVRLVTQTFEEARSRIEITYRFSLSILEQAALREVCEETVAEYIMSSITADIPLHHDPAYRFLSYYGVDPVVMGEQLLMEMHAKYAEILDEHPDEFGFMDGLPPMLLYFDEISPQQQAKLNEVFRDPYLQTRRRMEWERSKARHDS